MAKRGKKKKDAVRRAKLTIQRRTLALMLVLGVFSFLALFYKVYDLTIRRNEEMTERATKQQTMSITLGASRGSIYSKDGKTLATSATADTVFLDPRAINDRAAELDKKREKILSEGLKEGEKMPYTGEEYKELIATTLAPLLEIDEQEIYEKMEKTWSRYEILKKKVERETGDQIREFIKNNDSGGRIQGIHLESDSKRYYPHSTMAAHVLGFLDADNQGAYGLEAIYNDELEGTPGLVVTAKDGRERELMFQYEQYYDAENGNDLYLTIDSNIQYYLERGLDELMTKYSGKHGAAGLVMDVNSGAVLAIASLPTYDPSDPRGIYNDFMQAELDKVEKEEQKAEVPAQETSEEKPEEQSEEKAEETAGSADEPKHSDAYYKKKGELQLEQWRNKVINDTYEPGSTYKIITLAAALEEGKVNMNSSFTCNGVVNMDGWAIHCHKHSGHGTQNLAQATANSCNPAFISMGLAIGGERYLKYMDDFGLTSATGVDLQGEAVGVGFSPDHFTDLDLATCSFGQNFTVTPIQLMAAQAACVNGGYLYTPYVVDKVVDDKGNVVFQHDATPVRQVVSEETSATVRQILEQVVSDGTGKNGQVAGYRIGGKTGTAEKNGTRTPSNPQGDVVVSFLCFAPADDPQIMMLLTLDTPSRTTGTYVSGGNMVAPVSSKLMSDILPYLGIPPQYDTDELASVDATVPYVVGMGKDEAVAKMKEYGFASCRTVGDGATVTDQTPAGGAIVPASAEIILYLDAPKPTAPKPMPNVVGLTAAQANKKLTNSGFIMRAAGASIEGKGVHVIGQSHQEGVLAEPGTVVTVQMGQSSSIAD